MFNAKNQMSYKQNIAHKDQGTVSEHAIEHPACFNKVYLLEIK